MPLADVAEGAKVQIRRLENEARDLLYLKAAGIEPGVKGIVARSDDDHVVVKSDRRHASIKRSVAETAAVIADPSPPPRSALPEQLVLAKKGYGR